MGNDVRQILQDETNRGPQYATSSEQARRIQEQVVAEIANFRADFLNLRSEIQQVWGSSSSVSTRLINAGAEGSWPRF